MAHTEIWRDTQHAKDLPGRISPIDNWCYTAKTICWSHKCSICVASSLSYSILWMYISCNVRSTTSTFCKDWCLPHTKPTILILLSDIQLYEKHIYILILYGLLLLLNFKRDRASISWYTTVNLITNSVKQNLPWIVDRYLTSQKFSELIRSCVWNVLIIKCT